MAGYLPPTPRSGIESYETVDDVPDGLQKGRIVYIENEAAHYVETE